ncbi:DUF1285 domain-containing protein [Aidingimonas halophila]|nr:DUF1285 domain-containing protein [Aidingimonas halophila]GHC20611.1 hypothetical protein GCM10008094_08650 [Aidingimonas halophila]
MSLERFLMPLARPGTIPPLETWNPPFRGDLDLMIATDGSWWHEGQRMTRQRLVQLLSTVLWRGNDGDYFLVTPVEKWRIQVEDLPFLIIDATHCDTHWEVTTNMADRFCLEADHRVRLSKTPNGDWLPEVPVRFGLAARFHRNVFYRLVAQAEQREEGGWMELGITSDGLWHPLGRVEKNTL